MLFHLPSLVQRERTRLFEKARRKPNLANVMHEPAEMCEVLIFFWKPKTMGYVTGIDCDGGGVTSRVAIARVKRCNERRRKAQVRSLETSIRDTEGFSVLTLFSVK